MSSEPLLVLIVAVLMDGAQRTESSARPRNVRCVVDAAPVAERIIRFRVRTILTVLGLVIAVWGLLNVISVARQVVVWFFIALFLALAINPLVELLQRHGLRRRGLASAT